MAPLLLDARHLRCPLPVLRLRRALAALPAGAAVTLLADDPAAPADVPAFCRSAGHRLIRVEDASGGWLFHIVAVTPPASLR